MTVFALMFLLRKRSKYDLFLIVSFSWANEFSLKLSGRIILLQAAPCFNISSASATLPKIKICLVFKEIIDYKMYIDMYMPVLQRVFKDLRSFKDFCPKIHLRFYLQFIFRSQRIFEASKILGWRLWRFFRKILDKKSEKV